MEGMKARLAEAEKKLGNVELVIGQANKRRADGDVAESGGAEYAGVGHQPALFRLEASGAADS